MTLETWLKKAVKELGAADIGSARLDTQLLAAHVLNHPREWILAHPEYELAKAEGEKLDELLARRVAHHPVAHLVGHREFFGLDFEITPDVLTPRPESEPMITWAIQYAPKDGRLIDMGTGSGAIAIAIAKARPDLHVTGTDITTEALEVAHRNAQRHHAKLELVKSNLWDKIPGRYHTVVTNLPYLRDDEQLLAEVKREPAIALFGGPDGLDLYRQLLTDLPKHLEPGGYFFCESDPWQHNQLTQDAASQGLQKLEEDYFLLGFQLTTQS